MTPQEQEQACRELILETWKNLRESVSREIYGVLDDHGVDRLAHSKYAEHAVDSIMGAVKKVVPWL